MYDSRFPECDQYPNFKSPNEKNGFITALSYVYPDGVGWPYSFNDKKADADDVEPKVNQKDIDNKDLLLNAYTSFPAQEEIHNTGMVILGALWDAYEAIKSNHSGDIV